MRAGARAATALWQQGHRGIAARSTSAIRTRIVSIDSGTCRCARIGGTPRAEVCGYGSDLERESEERNARGGKKAPFHGKEAVCGYAERGVMMEAPPTAALVVVQTDLILELLVVALDTPPKLRGPDESGQRRIGTSRHRRAGD